MLCSSVGRAHQRALTWISEELLSHRSGGARTTGALQDAGVGAEAVDTVIMGQASRPAAARTSRQAASRQASDDVHGITINKVPFFGSNSDHRCGRMIALGDADVVIAGGQESMTNAPHLIPGSRGGHKYGRHDARRYRCDSLTDQTVRFRWAF